MKYLYLDHQQLIGEQWQQPLSATRLPAAEALVDLAGKHLEGKDKLTLLLKDDLMHPLRIQLDEKVSPKDLDKYLCWKLKSFLPYDVDQIALRSLPLDHENTWLTFSLPKAWLNALNLRFKERGFHCGYVGGLMSTLLENSNYFNNKRTLCFFEDFYMLVTLDRKGQWRQCHTRRLPYGKEGRLDVDELVKADLEALFQGDQQNCMINFCAALDTDFHQIARKLSVVDVPSVQGTALERYQSLVRL